MKLDDLFKQEGVDVDNKRLVAIEGASGTGKTRQCGTLIEGLPQQGLEGWNVAYLSAERKANTIKHLSPKIFTITNLDFPTSIEEKKAIKGLFSPDNMDFISLFDLFRSGEHEFDAVYIDSVSRYGDLLLECLFAKFATDKRQAYGEFGRKMKRFLDTLATLADGTVSKRPVHVITTWGVEIGKDWQGRRSFMPMVEGQMVHDKVNYYFDDVFFLQCDEDIQTRKKTFLMHTTGTQEFSAKVSSNVVLPPVIENPNLFKVMNILSGKLKMGVDK